MLDKLFGIISAFAEEAAPAAAGAADAAGEATGEPNSILALLTSMLPMLLIFVVFYFMLIRPQRKKDKKIKEMLDSIKVGDRICTIGGIYGTVSGIRDDTVNLIVGNENTPMVIARWAIRSVEEITVENEGDIIV
ncbi:MAG: preprotein translocase subunit YajC [Christensenellales bacterium]|jgi:preprotein translocase subunit YajC|nr:preprotein translocase subunit YajC [Christensenellaceae bacterium]